MITADTTTERITFRLTDELQERINQYVAGRQQTDPKYSKNDACIEALEALTSEASPITRYRDLLGYGYQAIRDKFSDNELNLILDSCNGLSLLMEMTPNRYVFLQPGSSIALNVHDSIVQNELAKKWRVPDEDAAGLVERLRKLGIVEQYALVDLIERFWANPNIATVRELL